MDKDLSRAVSGQPIMADDWNAIVETVEAHDRTTRGDGVEGLATDSFRGQRVPLDQQTFLVRITQDVFPEGSAEYVASPPTGTNAIPQVYSGILNSNGGPTGWVDDPGGASAILISNYGIVPLVTNDLVPVYFDTGASKWIPTYQILTNKVRVSSTTLNAAGFYDGFIQVANMDATPPTYTDGPQVHCQGPNNEVLSVQNYTGVRVGHKAGRALFVVSGPGTDNVAFIRPTTATADGSGRYTAKIQAYNVANLPNPWSDVAGSPGNAYLHEANGLTGLDTTKRYLSHYQAQSGGLPIYDFNVPPAAGSAVDLIGAFGYANTSRSCPGSTFRDCIIDVVYFRNPAGDFISTGSGFITIPNISTYRTMYVVTVNVNVVIGTVANGIITLGIIDAAFPNGGQPPQTSVALTTAITGTVYMTLSLVAPLVQGEGLECIIDCSQYSQAITYTSSLSIYKVGTGPGPYNLW